MAKSFCVSFHPPLVEAPKSWGKKDDVGSFFPVIFLLFFFLSFKHLSFRVCITSIHSVWVFIKKPGKKWQTKKEVLLNVIALSVGSPLSLLSAVCQNFISISEMPHWQETTCIVLWGCDVMTGVAPAFVRWREHPGLINVCTSVPSVIHSSDISTLLPLKPSDITLWPSDLINFLFPERQLPLPCLWWEGAIESDRRVPHCRCGLVSCIYFEGNFCHFYWK